jgi:hypothetical protein
MGGTMSRVAVTKLQTHNVYTAMQKLIPAVDKIKHQTTLQSLFRKH